MACVACPSGQYAPAATGNCTAIWQVPAKAHHSPCDITNAALQCIPASWTSPPNQAVGVQPSFSPFSAPGVFDNTADTRGAAAGDWNADGHLDLFVANDDGQANYLYINDGAGGFNKQTTAGGPGAADTTASSQGATAGDFNGDGHLDLFVANSCLLYTSPSPRDGLLSRMPSSA